MPKFVPDPTCILWLPGQEDYPSATIRDWSGNGNHGTITGATWVRLRSGLWVLNFGGDDYIDCGSNSSLNFTTSDFTLIQWMKITNVTADRTLFNRGTYNVDGYWWHFDNANRFLVFGTHQSGAVQRSNSTVGSISVNTWYHCAVTKIGTGVGSVILYINAVADTPVQGNHVNPATSSDTPWIGAYQSTDYRMVGNIGLPKAYSRGLSAPEIQNFFNQERHLFL